MQNASEGTCNVGWTAAGEMQDYNGSLKGFTWDVKYTDGGGEHTIGTVGSIDEIHATIGKNLSSKYY